jgi:hypothetical protein
MAALIVETLLATRAQCNLHNVIGPEGLAIRESFVHRAEVFRAVQVVELEV